MKRMRIAWAAVVFAAVVAGTVRAADYTWNGTYQDWNTVGAWTPTNDIPHSATDTALIATGQAKANTSLGAPGDYPVVTVTVGAVVKHPGGNTTINNPIVLNGATWQGETH